MQENYLEIVEKLHLWIIKSLYTMERFTATSAAEADPNLTTHIYYVVLFIQSELKKR